MNKVYTIGRDASCDIVIPDSTDVVSRVHASLSVKGYGKYILIDQSRNGTYVNGIRMSANEEIPVTRKDVISFAHIRNLDWEQIPKEKNSLAIWIFGAIAVIIIGCICFFILKPRHEAAQPITEKEDIPANTYEPPTIKDTIDRETIYIKPQPVVIPKFKKKKSIEKKEEKPPKEEAEVINPLL